MFLKKKDPNAVPIAKNRFKTNHHFIFVEAPLEFVAPEAMKWGEASWWPKKCLTTFQRTSDAGEVVQGTRFHQRVNLPLARGWDVEITQIDPHKIIERTFLNGMFSGCEQVKLEWRYNGTRVDYDLCYSLRGFWARLFWPLFLKKLHDANIKMILAALKDFSENQFKQGIDKTMGSSS